MDTRFGKVDARFTPVDARFDSMDRQLAATFVAMVGALLARS